MTSEPLHIMQLRAALARAHRKKIGNPAEAARLRHELDLAILANHIEVAVARVRPTPEQAERLAALLRSGDAA